MTTTKPLAAEVSQYLEVFATSATNCPGPLSVAAQDELLAEPESWLLLAQCPNLGEAIALRLLAEGTRSVVSALVTNPDIPTRAKLALVERATDEDLIRMSFVGGHPDSVLLRLVTKGNEETLLNIIKYSDSSSRRVWREIARRGSSKCLLELAYKYATHVDRDTYVTLSFRGHSNAWRWMNFSPGAFAAGVVSYRFAAECYPEKSARYGTEAGVPLDEWTALGETWEGDLQGLVEAWKLTRR